MDHDVEIVHFNNKPVFSSKANKVVPMLMSKALLTSALQLFIVLMWCSLKEKEMICYDYLIYLLLLVFALLISVPFKKILPLSVTISGLLCMVLPTDN